MRVFIVQNKPVVVRDQPHGQASIINALPVGTRVIVVSLDSGWFKTDSGRYIFNTPDFIPFSQWKKEHADDLIETELIDERVPPPLRKGFRKQGGAIQQGDTVIISTSGTKDTNTGNVIPSELTTNKTPLIVNNIDGTNVTVYDSSSNKQYTVPASSLKMESEGNWVDVSQTATDPGNSGEGSQDDATRQNTEEGNKSFLEQIEGALFSIFGSDDGTNPDFPDIGNLDVTSFKSIYGSPYQYTPITDPRISENRFDNKAFGRKFAQKIAARAPILIMQAGRADFLKGFDDDTKEEGLSAVLNAFQNKGLEILSGADKNLEQLVKQPGKFYSFTPKPDLYFNAVNQMTVTMARFLGLEDYEWDIGNGPVPLGSADFDWMQAIGPKKFINPYLGSVAFYINSEPQINESISNTSGPSEIANKINGLGKMGTQLQWLLSGVSNYVGSDLTMMEDMAYMKTNTDGGIINSVIDNLQTIIAGGRMIFPDIWEDSKFTRSYQVTIKLNSPDSDNLSIFLNIFVPLAHILAFVLPRNVGLNNYISPFMVRAYYKSMFHIDMGIVTDCQIQKGDVGAWTQNGLPTQITVQLQIKDLYNVISLAVGALNGDTENLLIGNPGQIDYVASLCGLNFDAMPITKAIQLWWAFRNPFNIVPALLNYMGLGLETGVQNWICSLLPGIRRSTSNF